MSRHHYIEQLLRAYQLVLGASRRPHPPDRLLAAALHRRHVPLEIVQAALLIGIARRTLRPANAPPLAPVRSLAYFLPIIDELRASPPDPRYLQYLRDRLGFTQPPHCSPASSPS